MKSKMVVNKLAQAQGGLANSLKQVTDEIILQEVLCVAFPRLKEARDEYRQQARAARVLNDFAQFVRESAEPPMIVELSGHNQMNDLFDQMGFIKSEATMFVHPVYDFFVYLVPTDCGSAGWKVDATKTSLRHFFRHFHAHVEQQAYDRVAIEEYRE